jgi:hypothetical protein
MTTVKIFRQRVGDGRGGGTNAAAAAQTEFMNSSLTIQCRSV